MGAARDYPSWVRRHIVHRHHCLFVIQRHLPSASVESLDPSRNVSGERKFS